MKSFYLVSLCLLTTTVSVDYLNKKLWFQNGNIYHIDQKSFWDVFQQHRNVNRHLHWLSNEISLLNSQIQTFKSQLLLLNHSTNQPTQTNQTKSLPSKQTNEHNIRILKQLSNETIFDEILEKFFEIYEQSVNRTIECIAVFFEQSSNKNIFLVKLTNGDVDQYEMNQTKSNRHTHTKPSQPTGGIASNNDKLPRFYRRFDSETNINELMMNDQFSEIKNRPKINDVNFFDMMGQVLRIKYHTDPSSLSCILEVFFGPIYTCDGRLIYPHELKLLSDSNNAFVFYAVMIDTQTEKQIYPIDTNSYILEGDQIFFLFRNHPQFNTLSSFSCVNCQQNEPVYPIDKNQQANENENAEVKPETDKSVVPSWISNPQNYIVYVIVTSTFLYILIGIYRSRKYECQQTVARRKSSISSRYIR